MAISEPQWAIVGRPSARISEAEVRGADMPLGKPLGKGLPGHPLNHNDYFRIVIAAIVWQHLLCFVQGRPRQILLWRGMLQPRGDPRYSANPSAFATTWLRKTYGIFLAILTRTSHYRRSTVSTWTTKERGGEKTEVRRLNLISSEQPHRMPQWLIKEVPRNPSAVIRFRHSSFPCFSFGPFHCPIRPRPTQIHHYATRSAFFSTPTTV